MQKHLLHWKPIYGVNVNGGPYRIRAADMIQIYYGGTLLSCMLAMKRQTPIEFADAIRLATDKYFECFDADKIGRGVGECFWYYDNFVDWISSQGYHIEISGEEFEAVTLNSELI